MGGAVRPVVQLGAWSCLLPVLWRGVCMGHDWAGAVHPSLYMLHCKAMCDFCSMLSVCLVNLGVRH